MELLIKIMVHNQLLLNQRYNLMHKQTIPKSLFRISEGDSIRNKIIRTDKNHQIQDRLDSL